MKLKVKKLTKDAQLPTYGNKQAAAFDLYANEQITILPGQTVAVGTGLAFDLPPTHYLEIYPRSGLSLNTNIRIANAPGIVDEDYRGEVKIIIDNIMTKFPNPYTVSKGQRLAQGIVRFRKEQDEFEEVNSITETERGNNGFGSTGL
jgi:dUTP pyrophosphatase